MWWIPAWSDVPEFKREEYFKDLIAERGNTEVYKGTGVDEATQESLNEYFKYDFLCDTPDRFIWIWHRALLEAYPVYKDQMEQWTERKSYKWYFDNVKDNTKTHDGTFTLDEDTKADLLRTVTRALSDVLHSTVDTDTTDSRVANGTTHSTSDEDTSGESTDNSKDRQFAFQYPESNYSGGVIPYDLDNNPNVEFISTQADRVLKSTNEHSDTTSSTSDGTSKDTEEAKGTSDTITDSTNKQDETTKQTDGQTIARDQETETHWTETTTFKGDSINQLAKELLEELPATDFFAQFVAKLKNCFLNSFLFDEIEEGL